MFRRTVDDRRRQRGRPLIVARAFERREPTVAEAADAYLADCRAGKVLVRRSG
jgi:hypothetical protein